MTKPDSYPFLKIARMFGVDYGDVLLVADRWRGANSTVFGNPHWIAADRRLYYQLTPENNMALSFAIEAANAEFKRIQAGEIDWQTGEELCQDEGCPHYSTPHGHGEPLGARNYQLFDASLDAGTNDMSDRPYKPRDPGPDATAYAGQRLEDQQPVCKYCGQPLTECKCFPTTDDPGEHQEVIDALNYRNSDDE